MSDRSRSIDEMLILLIRSGQAEAAERLALRWYPRLLRTARRVLRDDDLAREVVQDAWIGICRGWITLRDPSRFPAFAFGILHRKCADQLRRVVRNRRHDAGSVDLASYAAPGSPPDVGLTIVHAFELLPDDQRLAAHLYFLEDLTLAEVAAALSIPLGTVKSRLFTARAHLKNSLKETQDDGSK